MLNKSNASLLLITTILVGGVLGLALWRQRSDLKQLKHDYGQLAQKCQALQQALQENQIANAHRQPAAPAITVKPVSPSVSVPEINRLVWGGAEVKPISGGLLVTLQFKPIGVRALDEVYIAFELSKSATAKILDLTVPGAAKSAHVGKRVLRDGKLAVFQGVSEGMSPITLGLSISGPAVMDVRGSCGITPFQLDITPASAAVRGN